MNTGNRELTQAEIDNLKTQKEKQISSTLNTTTPLIVSIAGFCIATLSSQNIPAVYNFIISTVVLILLLTILLITTYPKNTLRLELSRLYKDCKNHRGSKEILDEMNIWLGFKDGKIKLWLPVLISTLFIVYTTIEHGIRAFCTT